MVAVNVSMFVCLLNSGAVLDCVGVRCIWVVHAIASWYFLNRLNHTVLHSSANPAILANTIRYYCMTIPYSTALPCQFYCTVLHSHASLNSLVMFTIQYSHTPKESTMQYCI